MNLAEAVIYLARAPKSNAVVVALGRAQADVRSSVNQEVPAHLRDAHYKGAAALGHGEGYVYPHDDPSGVVRQQYRPDALEGRVYYEPTPHGAEGAGSVAGPAGHREGGPIREPRARRGGGRLRRRVHSSAERSPRLAAPAPRRPPAVVLPQAAPRSRPAPPDWGRRRPARS